MMILRLFSIMILLGVSLLTAQTPSFSRRVDPFPIRKLDGSDFRLPLTGGLNSPVPQLVDINGDNRPDLFLQDRANQLIYYRNIGTPADYQFQWITDNFQDLQVGDWFKFADIDLDGDFDLLAENPFGIIRYYENVGNPTSFSFVAITDSLRDEEGAPIQVDAFSIPEWTDIDQDDQQELFLGRQSGRITYYDLIGFNGSLPIYRKMNDFFGGIEILTGGGELLPKNNNERHGANSLTFVDIDADGDQDLFWGDFFAESIIFLPNQGTPQNPQFDMNDLQDSFPSGDPLDTGGFNVPRLGDMDNDGDFDMLIGVLGGSGSLIEDRAENLYYYENTGTPALYNFVLRSKDFVEGIDIGQNTIVSTFDVDGDGDLDMFLTNQEDLASPDRANSRMYYFNNQGTPTAPEFQLIDNHYLNYDKRFDLNYAPAFSDLDNDGDQDMLLGKWDGKITYYRNSGQTTANFELVDEFWKMIDIGNNSAPVFADIDGDLDQDLFIGEFSGNIDFYRNQGTSQNPLFVLDTTHYAGLDVGLYCYPVFIDLDDDNDLDLLIGSETSGILHYRNDGTATVADFVFQGQLVEPSPIRGTPHMVDIDGDGDVDLLSGSAGGGLLYYENQQITGLNNRPADKPDIISHNIQLLGNYPNPFNPSTRIKYQISGITPNQVHQVSVFNILGEEVKQWRRIATRGTMELVWDGLDSNGHSVPSGLYFYRVSLRSGVAAVGKMILLK